MWWYEDDAACKGFTCNMYSLSKGPITLSILYTGRAGLMTANSSSSGTAPLAAPSSDCDGPVWLLPGVALVGGDKASPADPYTSEAPRFVNGFAAASWQDCCRAARAAPGTTLMERGFQHRARQFWSFADRHCVVKVRPFLQGASVVTLQAEAGAVSGMFGSEL